MRTTPRNLGVALTGDAYESCIGLTLKPRQEQASLFYWRPSVGKNRYSAIIDPAIPLAQAGETVESGNVAVKAEYLMRVLAAAPEGAGIGIIHSHLGGGWQDLSSDDFDSESVALAPVVFSARGLPLLGMTIGKDGTLSARFWQPMKNGFRKSDVATVRVVGESFHAFNHPQFLPRSHGRAGNRVATIDVWGPEKQALLESIRIGIVGLGSVGSMVAEALARMGVRQFVLVDFDKIEKRNLDRTIGASRFDVWRKTRKVRVAKRNIRRSATSSDLETETISKPLQEAETLRRLLDCDAIFSCVDRHLPRYVLNFLALSHLIPVIDGGIAVDLPTDTKPSLDISWRMHMAGPDRPCLGCLEAYEYAKFILERDGLIDNQTYINNAPDIKKAYEARQNVFCFSMSCAAHEVLQCLGYLLDNKFVSPALPQMFHAQAGQLFIAPFGAEGKCGSECQVKPFTAKAHDLAALLR